MSLVMLLSALVAVPAPAPVPIDLTVREEGEMLRLSVVGHAAEAYTARYALEVEGRGPSGTNRTTQGGATALKPGETVTLLSVALGRGGAGRWAATLTVTPAEGAPYRREMRSTP